MSTYNFDETLIKIEENMRKDDGHRGFVLSDRYIAPYDKTLTGVSAAVLVLGDSGTGKTENVVLPNILDMRSSYIVIDRGGKLYKETKDLLQENDYEVKLLDFSNRYSFTHYNPFKYMSKDDPLSVWNVVDKVVQGTSMHDPFWYDTERNILASALFLQIEQYPTTSQNFSVTHEILKCGLDKGEAALDDVFDWPFAEDEDGCFALRTYKAFKAAPNKTRRAVLLDVLDKLSFFTTADSWHFTTDDNLHLEMLKTKKTAIFIDSDTTDEHTGVLISLLIMQAYETLENIEFSQKNRKRPVPVAFILDDFCDIGMVMNLLLHVGVNAGIFTMMVANDWEQIKKCYGKEVLDILRERVGYIVRTQLGETCYIQMDAMSLEDRKARI